MDIQTATAKKKMTLVRKIIRKLVGGEMGSRSLPAPEKIPGKPVNDGYNRS